MYDVFDVTLSRAPRTFLVPFEEHALLLANYTLPCIF